MKRSLGLLAALAAIAIACAGYRAARFEWPIEAMRMPPRGLAPGEVPLFVCFGSDDNPYSGLPASGDVGGLHYLTELFASRSNPAGTGAARSFDGRPPHFSFYVNTKYAAPGGEEDPALVVESWHEALGHGHEIAAHTHGHPHGQAFSVGRWEREIRLCVDRLEGVGVSRDRLRGFRTPYLEYGDHTLTAVQRAGFAYDCSIEEGFQRDQDGRGFLWPYTLDDGSPGNAATYRLFHLPLVRGHPGLWELPVYAFSVPPDERCEAYGVAPGLRSRLEARSKDFEIDQGKITGMDWNLWVEYGVSAREFLAILEYTLDLRLEGNRCPLTVGLHSGLYSDRSREDPPPQATPQERRDALRAFLDYALSKPEVRVVSAAELLDWVKTPAPLASLATENPGPKRPVGAGFRYSVFNTRVAPEPGYWSRVGREMVARFPGSSPEAIWIVSHIKGRGAELSFPVAETGDPLISGSAGEDRNEAALSLFDSLGYRVWLQVEPGFAPVETLIHLTLRRYSRHPCVAGVGVDVEWNRSLDPDGGEPVSDAEARAWLAAARSHDPRYRLFLKHWLPDRMPPTVRDGLLFVDDSQVLPSLDAMVGEFVAWGKAFAPAPVAFQFGYPSDRPWWSKLADPPKEIGSRILAAVPNVEGVFWVDFSVLEVFPPDRESR